MSELQNQDDQFEEVEVEEVEQVDQDEQVEESDLAPDSEPEHEENTEEADDGKVNQEAINKVINRKHYEAQEAKREAEELRQRLAKYEQQNSQAPVVPEKPDPFDDDYDSKLDMYVRAVAAKERFDYEQQNKTRQQQEAQQRQQYEQQQKLEQDLGKYVENGKKAGMTVEEMTQAGQIVESYGINQDLQMALISDNDGALMVKHLAANPQEASNIAQMTPYQAALHIERVIRPAAKALKPKSTNTPKPSKRVESGLVDPELGKYKHIGGAKFE